VLTAVQQGDPAMISPGHPIVAILRAQRGILYCSDCLALRVGASLQEARRLIARLGNDGDFRVSQGQCSECLRIKTVVGASKEKAATKRSA
jgi:hypothetical protein